MRPLTDYIPKAMIPVAGIPLLERIIINLRNRGFTELIVALSGRPDYVTHYFGDGARVGVSIDYSISETPSGTAGEVQRMRDMLGGDEALLVHYGDILTDLDLRAMADDHLRHRPSVTLGLVTGVPIHTGLVEVDEGGAVRSFVEKPALESPANAAVFVIGRDVIDCCAPDRDFSHDIFPRFIASGRSVRGFVDEDAYWIDVGRLSDLDRANKFFEGAQP